MKMPDRLAGTGSIIDDESVVLKALFFCDLASGPVEMANQFFVGRFDIGDLFQMFKRDDEDMGRGLGVDVLKGETLLVFVDDLCGDLFFADFAEEAAHKVSL